MTTRQLRRVLLQVENQDLTVKELRAILFEVAEQDEPLTDGKLARITVKKKSEKD